MTVKEKKFWNLKKIIFGDEEIVMSVLGTTIFMSLLAALIGFIYMFITHNINLAYIFNAVLLSSIIIIALAIVSLIGAAGFQSTNWMLWRRIMAYHAVVLIILMIINTIGTAKQQIREEATKISFLTTDLKACNYLIKLESKHLNYNYCVSSHLQFKDLKERKYTHIFLVGKKTFNVTNVDHVEIE